MPINPGSNIDMLSILNLAMTFEQMAIDTYTLFANTDKSLSHFWNAEAEIEKHHLAYWQELIDLTNKHILPQVFDDEKKILKELESIHTKLIKLNNDYKKSPNTKTAFIIALRLEFYMLHPAFATIFMFLENTSPKNPGHEYKQHINGIIKKYISLYNATPENELLGDTMLQLWDRNLELAGEFYKCKALSGFLPICASCKKIRDEQNQWINIEEYFTEHSEAEFTHGLCPECADKLYPELKIKE